MHPKFRKISMTILMLITVRDNEDIVMLTKVNIMLTIIYGYWAWNLDLTGIFGIREVLWNGGIYNTFRIVVDTDIGKVSDKIAKSVTIISNCSPKITSPSWRLQRWNSYGPRFRRYFKVHLKNDFFLKKESKLIVTF